MSTNNEIVSFVLSGEQIGDEIQGANIFRKLSEISVREELDSEYIIVVSYSDDKLQSLIKTNLSNYPVQIVVMGERNSWDQAMFAGLSRANGDYALLMGKSIDSVESFLPEMLRTGRANDFDIVGMRRKISFLERVKGLGDVLLFRLLRNRAKSLLSLSNCDELLVTRKALNWIIRDLSSANCLIEMFLIPGFNFTFIASTTRKGGYKLSRSMRSKLLTRYTHVPQSILKLCFSMTSLVMLAASINAISVRWRGLNILNHPDVQIPGWTTMVILVSFGFSVTIYSLYVLLRTILHLADQYSSKPSHVIKSVQRP